MVVIAPQKLGSPTHDGWVVATEVGSQISVVGAGAVGGGGPVPVVTWCDMGLGSQLDVGNVAQVTVDTVTST